MGVPSFFKYLVQNYKKNDFIIKNGNKKSIDYLMFDANGLMHPVCFKTIAENPTLMDIKLLENKMHNNILKAFEELINYVKPQVGVFIAIDGVAPVAKIKQQRYRRFKSVNDKNIHNEINKIHNKPPNHPWNNSAITPGTEFMNILHLKILDWIKGQKINIIYSSCNTPGEGEHKLIQYIKSNSFKSYIIYGLDADLIFLCLATGLNNLYLLREASEINHKDSNDLVYVSIDVLRKVIPETMKKYLSLTSQFIDTNLINDFIFLCYFLGNDFLPHITAIDINKEGIQYLLKAYGTVINSMNVKYIINNNTIDEELLFKFIESLASNEESILKYNYQTKKDFRIIEHDPYKRSLKELENLKLPEIKKQLVDPIKVGSDTFNNWRKRHYKYYWNIENTDELEDFAKEIVKNYIMGLKWVTLYYFDECKSWEWYYPYDQAPYLNEIFKYMKLINIKEIEFTKGFALKPYVQLLSVLPPQSNYLLPKGLRKLMTDDRSSLKYLYPISFKQDFINKAKFWQGIPMLPPIDINLVNKIYHKYEDELSEKELSYNKIY